MPANLDVDDYKTLFPFFSFLYIYTSCTLLLLLSMSFVFHFTERLAGRLLWGIQEESEAMCEKESGILIVQSVCFCDL